MGKIFERESADTGDDWFSKWLYLFLVLAVLFFVFSVSVAVFTFFRGDVFISVENVQVIISGPDRVSSGDELVFEVEVLNRNTVAMENVEMIVEYPEGSRDSDSPQQSLSRTRTSLEDISPGGRLPAELKFAFFGEQGDEGVLRVEIEYSVTRSNARFPSRAEHTLIIDDSPLSLSAVFRTDVHAAQPSDLQLTVKSNSSEDLSNVLIKAEYPVGFSLVRAEPSPSRSDNQWRLSSLPAGETRVINITGEFAGSGGDERTLRFFAGLEAGSSGDFLAVLSSAVRTVVLRDPHLSVNFNLPGATSDRLISQAGRQISGTVSFTNNLNVELRDVELRLDFEGSLVDLSSVSVEPVGPREDRGFFDPRTSEVVWSHVDMSGLRRVAVGQTVQLPLRFRFYSEQSTLRLPPFPQETISLSVSGLQTEDIRLSEQIRIDRPFELLLSSDIVIDSRGLYSAGPFVNSGPIPPTVGELTTYTVVIGLSSSLGDVENLVLEANLPGYVEFLDVVEPPGIDLRFNSATNNIAWHLPLLEAGRGFESSPREVAFQVRYDPRLPHRGNVVTLLENIRLSGVDVFTGRNLTFSGSNVTTSISQDPQYQEGDGSVQ